METETMIEMMNKVISCMTEEEKQDMEMYMDKIGKKLTTKTFTDACYMCMLPNVVGEIMRVLTIELAKEQEKATGTSKQATVIKAVIKAAEKRNHREFYSHIVDGKQYVCDGFRLFAFNQICESVPIEEKEKSSYADILKKRMEQENTGELTLPSRGKLAAYVKAEKARLKPAKQMPLTGIPYNFGEGLPMVSAELMLSVMDGIKNGRWYYNGTRTPILIIGENGTALLMPIDKKGMTTEDKTTEL